MLGFQIVADQFSAHLLCNWLAASAQGLSLVPKSLTNCDEERGRCTGRGLFQRLPHAMQTLGSADPAPQPVRPSVDDWSEGKVPLSLWLTKSTTESTSMPLGLQHSAEHVPQSVGTPFAPRITLEAAPRSAMSSDREVCGLNLSGFIIVKDPTGRPANGANGADCASSVPSQ